MAESRLETSAAEWDAALGYLGVRWGRRAAVVGANAGPVAEALLLAPSPPILDSNDQVAILGHEALEFDVAAATPAAVPLPDASLDLVVVVHAWEGPADLPIVGAEAARLVAPGGAVVFAELDNAVLWASNPRQYASALLALLYPEVVDRVVASCVSRPDLEVAANRLRLTSVASERVDVTRGIFPDPRAHAGAIRSGLWRGSQWLDGAALDRLASITAGIDQPLPRADREPWMIVRGLKPA